MHRCGAARRLAPLLLAVALLRGAAAQQPAPRSCPVAATYFADMGDADAVAAAAAGAAPSPAYFVGSLTLQNNDADTPIDAWRAQWRFDPAGTAIALAQDVFSPAAVLETPGSPVPVLSSTPGAAPLAPGAALTVGFLATKGAAAPPGPFNVEPPQALFVNNLACDPDASGAAGGGGAPAAAAAPAPAPLEVLYLPVQKVNETLAGPFTQFLARVRNVQDAAPVDLADVALQYFFAAPAPAAGAGAAAPLPRAADYAPWDYFEARCEYASVGCENVALALAPGSPAAPGARFAVNVSFLAAAGLLRPAGAEALPPGLFDAAAPERAVVESADLLLTLEPRPAGPTLDAARDYSYLDTAARPLDAGVLPAFVPRRLERNARLPAYVRGRLAWGVPPQASAAAAAASSTRTLGGLALPPGVTCEEARAGAGGARRACGLAARYCCRPLDGSAGVSATPPAVFPPVRPEGRGPVLELPPGAEPPAVSPPVPADLAGNSSGGGGDGGDGSGWVAGVVGAAAAVAAVGALALGVAAVRRRRAARRLAAQAAVVTVTWGDGKGGPSSPPGSPFSQLAGSSSSQLLRAGATPPWRSSDSASNRSGSPTSSPHVQLLQPSAAGLASATGVVGSLAFGIAGSAEATRGALSPGAAAAAAAAEADAAERAAARAEAAERHRNAAVLLLRKAATIHGLPPRRRAAPPRLPSTNDFSGDFGSSDDGDAPPPPESPRAAAAPRRTRSWAGELHAAGGGDDAALFAAAARARRGAPAPPALPPLSALPPPLLVGGAPPEGVDLDVPWEEVAPALGRCLGAGGFGAVYEATFRGRCVAVKVLPPLAAAGGSGGPAAEALADALRREARLAARFRCDRLVAVVGGGTRDAAHPFLLMELVEGGNLAGRIYDRRRRRLGYLEILAVARDVAAGLAYLHPSIVHRDLKPQNILLDADGRAKVADFGISRVKDPSKSYLSQATSEAGAGTPQYMAPEQFNGARVDEKADVFALGVVLNEAATRRQPWSECPHLFQVILRVAINGERPWTDPDTPEPLARLIAKCWAQDPRARPSCLEVMRAAEVLIATEAARWEDRALPAARRASAGGGGGGGGRARAAGVELLDV